MSLFTLTDIWSYDCAENNPHTFSHKSVIIGNVDNEEEEIGGGCSDKIVLASYSGLLRIISTTNNPSSHIEQPSTSVPDDENETHDDGDSSTQSPGTKVNLKGNLLAELHLGAPILQIEAGYFLGISDKLDLAILHPHRLGIYTITKLPGAIELGSQYKVTLLYEHSLKRHAFNMCFGKFGSGGGGGGTSKNSSTGTTSNTMPGKKSRKGKLEDKIQKIDSQSTTTLKRKDFLCVQSLDGTLSFFEQEVYTFSCYLPNFLLPGPIAYVPDSDSFLTINSSWELESFKYSQLVAINDSSANNNNNSNSKDEGARGENAIIQTQESSLGKRLTPDWAYSLGEEPICDIQVLSVLAGTNKNSKTNNVIEDSAGQQHGSRIVISTFRHLYCFSISGELIWSKRLDFQMSCFISFLNSANECITLATSIASSSSSSSSEDSELGTLYVYNGTMLKWAAKLPFPTVFVGRIQVNDVPGGIVLLSSKGHLVVECLGTEPSLFVAPSVESRDLDYEAAEIELASLRKIIATAGEQDIVASKDTTVEIKVEFEGQSSKWLEELGQSMIVLVATVKLVCRVRVNDVRVTIYSPKPIVCTQESVHIGDIVGRHTYTIEFYPESDAIPSDLSCEIIVFYSSDNGIPHFIQKSGIHIPLFIITKPYPTLDKTGASKLTFSVNKPVLNLITLYNDFEWAEDTNPNSLTFQLCGGEKVTVLASTKNTSSTPTTNSNNNTESGPSRYRIQSDMIAGIHLVFHDFLERLSRKYGRNNSDLEINIIGESGGGIPLLEEYFNDIEEHVLRRRREIQIRDDITDRAAQLRAIQRRLLIRFRDKNISPLTHLETLLDGSLDHLMDVLNIMDQNELEKQKSESKLSGATKLMLELSLIQGKRKIEELAQLSSALCPHVSDFINDLGWEESIYTNLSYLKTQQVVSCSNFSQLDSSKLKKVIKSTLEKIKQASAPLANPNSNKNSKEGSKNVGKEEQVLVGNEIIERMASARSKTARSRRINANNVVGGGHSLDSIPEPIDGETNQNRSQEMSRETSQDEDVVKDDRNIQLVPEKLGSRRTSLKTGGGLESTEIPPQIPNGGSSMQGNDDDDGFW